MIAYIFICKLKKQQQKKARQSLCKIFPLMKNHSNTVSNNITIVKDWDLRDPRPNPIKTSINNGKVVIISK